MPRLVEFMRQFARNNSVASLPTRMRCKRFRWFVLLVDNVRKNCDGPISVIDFGGTSDYWYQVYDVKNNPLDLKITLLNLSFPNHEDPWFSYITGDVTNLQTLSDQYFTIGFSNSLIEHVGTIPQQVRAIAEMKRVASFLYLQTPNFWFPWEPHYNLPFVHWFPLPIRFRILSIIDLRLFSEEVMAYDINPINLLSLSIVKSLFAEDQHIYYYERFLIWTKSFVICSLV